MRAICRTLERRHERCYDRFLKNLLLLLVLRRSLQIPIPAWAMKATVFSSSGRGPYSFVCMSTLSLQMDCLTLLYSLQSCRTCFAVSAACPHEQRSVLPTLNILWMWYFSWLCPVLSLKMVVWPCLFRQCTPSCLLCSGWLSFYLLFRLVFIMDFTSLYVRSLSICSSTDPSFARLSARSFPSILQWAGIHCRTRDSVFLTTFPRHLARYCLSSPFESSSFSKTDLWVAEKYCSGLRNGWCDPL